MTTLPPLIGITTYSPNTAGDYCLEADYVAAVRRAGGIPILLPPGEPQLAELLDRLDGVILSGGGDVDPAHYGSPGHPEVYAVEPVRDAAELQLARTLAAGDMPSLCICRGVQVLNVALGGTLVEHLPDETGGDIAHRDDPPGATLHAIHVQPGTHLATLLGGPTVEAASWHHQAIRAPAPGLTVTATAPDGTIEAVELPGHPWLVAIQWHPELTAAHDALQQGIFDAFVAAARTRMERRNHEEAKGRRITKE